MHEAKKRPIIKYGNSKHVPNHPPRINHYLEPDGFFDIPHDRDIEHVPGGDCEFPEQGIQNFDQTILFRVPMHNNVENATGNNLDGSNFFII